MRRLHFSISKRIILAFVATTSVLSVQARAFAATSHALMRDGRTPSSTTTAATATTLRAVLSPTITTVAGSSSSRKITGTLGLLVLRGGGNAVSPGVPHISDLAMGAYEWCVNLCAPSALVAGAVIATIYENIGSGALDIRADSDTRWVMFGKRITRLLLLSAFAFEVLSIFVTTVTGTMLLSHTEATLDARMPTKMINQDSTPLSFLHDNFEFEYLTARLTFLQGILNWLGAIGLGHILPSGESTDSRVMNQFIGLSLMLLMVIMLAFYNNHMNFYANYAQMLTRWISVCWTNFVWTWPPRPSIVFSLPLLAWIVKLGYMAFFCENHHVDGKEDPTTSQSEQGGGSD